MRLSRNVTRPLGNRCDGLRTFMHFYPEFYGITGGYIPGYRHDVTLVFENNPIPASIPFCPEFPEEEFSGILGREDFFSLYRIRFIEKKRSMEFIPDMSDG